ncbi:outer membrane biogenesis protein BamB [Limihaloglobus sulfuriphilus]|uniref:Outer membrane biogenesis protein BamB n=1 Tax=Limihaloglobus sulfuriphilus TaxID=1851148 RepID=A0A1Q2MAH9_9BACT|nr:PQQ-binding-like beta-propeller repeat protein [Limihaloglobus sulfuriphilus]AQQ69686.1 outer membrane biogenesis protein BamB [Limihaloglobus sulfuriphilus]
MPIYYKIICSLTISLLACGAAARDWPDWRGPGYNGSSDETGLPEKWSQTENVKWAGNTPGPGSGTPVVSRGKVFITAVDMKNKSLLGMCFRQSDGKLLWSNNIGKAFRNIPRGNMAAPSAAVDGGRVFFIFDSGDLAAFDYEGKPLWKRNIEEEYGNISLNFGYSSTPLIYEAKMFVCVLRRPEPWREPKDRTELDSFLMALDPATGRNIWKTNRPTNAVNESFDSYSSPLPFEYNGRKEILLMGADFITSNDPKTGKELWRYEYSPNKNPRNRNIAGLVASKELIYLPRPRGEDLLAIKPGGSGTLDESCIAWKYEGPCPDCSTPLLYDGCLYVLDGMRKKALSCLDAETGKLKWQGTLSGPPIYSSLTAADGKLYCINEEGKVFVIRAGGEQLEIISEIQMNGKPANASIAIADSCLFIRTSDKLYCISESNRQ